MSSLSVAVLAYNEELNVQPVLSELAAWGEAYCNAPESKLLLLELLVVDDGSSDATAQRVQEFIDDFAQNRAERGFAQDTQSQPRVRLRLLRHDENAGMGAAIKTAARAATGAYFSFYPADGQIPPDALGTLFNEAVTTNSDLVLSTYKDREDGLHRTVLSAGLRALIFAVHGIHIQSEGPYLVRRPLLDASQLRSDTFFLNFEFPIRLLASGSTSSSVRINCRPRLSGVSKTAERRRAAAVASELLEVRLHAMKRRARAFWG